jgi:hypothetical protein
MFGLFLSNLCLFHMNLSAVNRSIFELISVESPRENQPAPQIRNPNFRRNPPQIRQREPREQREQRGPDQQIRPPFQKTMLMRGKKLLRD